MTRFRLSGAASLCVVAAVIAGCSVETPLEPDCIPDSRSAYACHTDAALLELIVGVDGRVSVGFKETGATYGVDPKGQNVTSDETTHAMKRLLLERGMDVRWQSVFIPAVSGRIPLRPELLAELRRHPNIDYIEPDVGGTWASR